MQHSLELLTKARDYIISRAGKIPLDIGLILGSGLGDLAEEIKDPISIPFEDIPAFPAPTVSGHAGRMVIGKLEGKNVICLQGRYHYYEGYDMSQLVIPVQVMKLLGVNNLLVTNAAGCVNRDWKPGDLMIITDHIKLVADNPLRGRNIEELGTRFFDMSKAYNPELVRLACSCAEDLHIPVRQGVYQFFSGPAYETPAEVRFAALCGADAVGMSTVPEVLAANHAGMNVLGISCLTNMAAGILDQPLDHQEVLETSQKVKVSFATLVKEILGRW